LRCAARDFALVRFRLKGSDEANKELTKACNDSGRIHFIRTKVDGVTVLRLAIGGIEQRDMDIEYAWSAICEQADRILARGT